MRKITIVGAGRVGEATAQLVAIRELCTELVLVDIRPGVAAGAALDIQESAALFGFDTRLVGGTELAALEGSGMVVVTAGRPRAPGMSRSDLLGANRAIADEVVAAMQRLAPDALLLMVTNPVDVITWLAWQGSGWPRQRVFGLSGVLDAARMAAFIALETGYSAQDVTAMVLGGHGDAMVPLPRYTTIHGLPIAQFMDEAAISRVIARTQQAGAEILALKQTSSAYDAPAAAITAMVDACVRDRRRVLPCVAVLDGEYGERGIAMGVPVVLDASGVSRIIELPLTNEEQTAFRRSVAGVRADIGYNAA